MAIIVFEDATFDKILAYLGEQAGFSILESLQNLAGLSAKLNLQKKLIDSWPELGQLLDSSESDIFGSSGNDFSGNDFSGNEFTSFLVNYGDLKFEPKILIYLEKLDQHNVYLYTSTDNSLSPDVRQSLKKARITLISLKKIDEQKQIELATEYRNQMQLMITAQDIAKIVKNCGTFQEVIDALDFLRLLDNPKDGVDELILKVNTPIFWLGFEVTKLKSQVNLWYQNVTDKELQLALTLISSKLDKQNTLSSRKLLKQLILTDKNLKTNAKIDQMTWWKYFLWQANQV